MGGHPTKEELNRKIIRLENEVQMAKNEAAEEQNKLLQTIQKLLEEKNNQEKNANTNRNGYEKDLLENMKKMQLESSNLFKTYQERMERQQIENEKLLREEKLKREKLEKEQRRKEEEFREKLLKEQEEQQKSYQNMLLKIQNEAKKAKEEEEKKFKEELTKKEKQFKELELKIKNERNKAKKEALEKEKKALAEQRKKEENAEKDFNQQSKELTKKQIDKCIKEFEKEENNFCKDEISKFDTNKIVELIKKLNKSEQLDFKIENILRNYSQNYSSQNNKKQVNHLNIILVGPTGVGKSTLINSILKLPKEEEAKTQSTDPCTMGEPKFYESNNMPSIRLADSRGIEKGSYGVEQVVTSTEDFINYQIKTQDPDKFIHCIWYCITDSRFEDIEVQSLKRLADIYDNSKLPIIVVYTRAIYDNFINGIKKKVEDLGRNLGFVPVIAKDIEIKGDDEDDSPSIIKKKGLEKLKRMSIEKAKDAISSSCYSALKKNITEIVKTNLEIQSKNLKEYLQIMIDQKIQNLREGTTIPLMNDTITEIIIEIIKIYLSDQNDPITSEGFNHIKNFLDDFFKESMNFYSECLQILINEKAEKYSQEIINLQLEIIKKHHGNLKKYQDKNDFEAKLKQEILTKLKPKAELYCMKNAAKFITQPMKDYFEKFIENKYTKIIDGENIQIIFQEEAAKTFDKLDTLIMDKNYKFTPC